MSVASVAMLLADELLACTLLSVRYVLEQLIQSAVQCLAYPIQIGRNRSAPRPRYTG